jgi:hypothetical protein
MPKGIHAGRILPAGGGGGKSICEADKTLRLRGGQPLLADRRAIEIRASALLKNWRFTGHLRILTSMRELVITPCGRLGNQMAQYLVAIRLQQLVGGGVAVSGYNMPEWGLVAPVRDLGGQALPRLTGNLFDLRQVSGLMKAGKLEQVNLTGYGFRLEHFPSNLKSRELFISSGPAQEVLGDDELLINIRAEDILNRGIHPDYGLLPVEFYRSVVRRTGLKPVLQGQLEAGPYVDGLVKALPNARLIPSQGAVADFQIIRQAKNIVLSLSSFTWLAAWLSEAHQIHIPVYGFLNPKQRPDIDLLPTDDARYQFYAFPLRRWNGSLSQQEDLLQERILFREMSLAEVCRVRRRAAWYTVARRLFKKASLAWACARPEAQQ